MRVSEQRLSDRLAVQVVIGAYPPELVERAITSTGRAGARNRLLPPRVVVYFVLAMSLFADEGYEEVARRLAQGLSLSGYPASERLADPPSTAAVSRARVRLGAAPLKSLFAQTAAARDGAGEDRPGSRYRGWRLRVMDGYQAVVPHSPQNAATYGRAAGGPHRPAPPSARVSVLVENGGSELLAADVSAGGGCPSVPVKTLARQLGPGDLVLAEGDYARPAVRRTLAEAGADLLWKVPVSAAQPGGELLADGSRLCALRDAGGSSAGGVVRLLGTVRPGGRGLLATTVLDPAAAPAHDLRDLYERRWSFQQCEVFGDRQKLPLRSRSPEMVEQEIWGHLLVYSAIRRLANSGLA